MEKCADSTGIGEWQSWDHFDEDWLINFADYADFDQERLLPSGGICARFVGDASPRRPASRA